jgi:hypothetical protein
MQVWLLVMSPVVQASELVNDGWSEGLTAAVQTGFGIGDIAAARFTQASSCPCLIKKVRVFFGGAAITKAVRLHIWEDSAGTSAPGPEVFAADYELTGDNNTLQVIDLDGSEISVSGTFRVGIEFLDIVPPGIASDTDGDIRPDTNFIFFASAWNESSLFGISGDFIVRATIESEGGIFEDGFE